MLLSMMAFWVIGAEAPSIATLVLGPDQTVSQGLLRDDDLGLRWQSRPAETNEQLMLVYQEIIQKISGMEHERNIADCAVDAKNIIEKVSTIRELVEPSNVSISKIHVMYETQDQLQYTTHAIPKVFVSGKARAVDAPILFAKSYGKEIENFLSKDYAVEITHPYKKHESDQLLFYKLYNPASPEEDWLEQVVQKCKDVGNITNIKGVLIETVSFFDPCRWCSAMIKREVEKCHVIKGYIQRKLQGLPLDKNFRVGFHFLSAWDNRGSSTREGIADDKSWLSCYYIND